MLLYLHVHTYNDRLEIGQEPCSRRPPRTQHFLSWCARFERHNRRRSVRAFSTTRLNSETPPPPSRPRVLPSSRPCLAHPSCRSNRQLTPPGPSPPRDALARRPRKYEDEDGPLPVKMLSVPHPSGRGGSVGAGAAAGAGVTPAKLPPSRWARGNDDSTAADAAAAATTSASGGRKETRPQKTPSGSIRKGGERSEAPAPAASAGAAPSSQESSPTVTPGSRKRKTSDDQGNEAAAGDGSGSAMKTAASATDTAGDGGRGKGQAGADGGADKGEAGGQPSDPSDEPAVEPHRTKRARTNSEILRLAQQQRQQQSPPPPTAAAATGGKDGSPRAANGTGHGVQASPSPAAAVAATTAKGKADAGAAAVAADAGGAPGATSSGGGRGQEDARAAEEARRLEARRRGHQSRSPYVHGGVGRVDPNAGLPTSVRPSPADLALGGGRREAGDGGDGETKSSGTPAKPPAPKVCTAIFSMLFCLSQDAFLAVIPLLCGFEGQRGCESCARFEG